MGFGTAEGSFLPVAEKSVDSQIFSLAWIPSSARFCTLGTDIKGENLVFLMMCISYNLVISFKRFSRS